MDIDGEKGSIENECQLCLKVGRLQKSHIIPKFIYKKIRDDNFKVIKVLSDNPSVMMNEGGITEKLFCEKCETIFKKYEDYFNEVWYLKSVLVEDLSGKNEIHIDVDNEFLLFHLSILFRMSISSKSEFSAINLDESDIENLRLLLLNANNVDDNYLVSGTIIHKDGYLYDQVLTRAEMYQKEEHIFCKIIYSGVEWLYKISKNEWADFREIAFNTDKKFAVKSYEEIEALYDIGKILNKFK